MKPAAKRKQPPGLERPGSVGDRRARGRVVAQLAGVGPPAGEVEHQAVRDRLGVEVERDSPAAAGGEAEPAEVLR